MSRRLILDFAANVLLYVPFGIAAFSALPLRRRWWAAAAALGAGAALSLVIEVAQTFTPTRTCNAADLTANVIGAAAGTAFAMFFERKWSGAAIHRRPASTGAVLLVCCWVGYQTYPLMVETSRLAIIAKINGLIDPAGFRLASLALAAAEWMAIDILVRSTCRRPLAVIAGLALLVPGRVMVRTRAVDWPELAAIPAAFALWRLIPQRHKGTALSAGVLAIGLLWNGMAAVRPGEVPASFQWTPFGPVVSGSAVYVAPVLLAKLFRYGALVWLLRASGMAFAPAGAAVTMLLSSIEFGQLYVGGHVAEITDPLLAAAMTLILAAFERWPGHKAEGAGRATIRSNIR
jgi:VanZ family protein